MKGKDIYDKIIEDFLSSNDFKNDYVQLLQTIFFELSAKHQTKEFYNLLEVAETQNKKLTLVEKKEPFTTCNEIFLIDIVLK
jgi:hypothetical protein